MTIHDQPTRMLCVGHECDDINYSEFLDYHFDDSCDDEYYDGGSGGDFCVSGGVSSGGSVRWW